jgi:hypothetical protein
VKVAERKGYLSVTEIAFCYQTQLIALSNKDRNRCSFNTVFLVEGKLLTVSRNLVVPRSNIHIMKPRKKERKKEIKKNKKSTDIKIIT